MREYKIEYLKKYYIDDDSYLDRDTIDSVQQILFEEPKEFKEIFVYWVPNYERYCEDIDEVLGYYEEEYENFCLRYSISKDDEIEFYCQNKKRICPICKKEILYIQDTINHYNCFKENE